MTIYKDLNAVAKDYAIYLCATHFPAIRFAYQLINNETLEGTLSTIIICLSKLTHYGYLAAVLNLL